MANARDEDVVCSRGAEEDRIDALAVGSHRPCCGGSNGRDMDLRLDYRCARCVGDPPAYGKYIANLATRGTSEEQQHKSESNAENRRNLAYPAGEPVIETRTRRHPEGLVRDRAGTCAFLSESHLAG